MGAKKKLQRHQLLEQLKLYLFPTDTKSNFKTLLIFFIVCQIIMANIHNSHIVLTAYIVLYLNCVKCPNSSSKELYTFMDLALKIPL